MFQYAAGRALTRRKGGQLKLDTRAFAANPLRRYELGRLRIVAEIATPSELDRVEAPMPAWWAAVGRAARLFDRRRIPRFRERGFRYDPALGRQPLPLYMEGYWQSERYFGDIAAELRHELTPTEPISPANAPIAESIRSVEAVSLHVRRGDYVSRPETNHFHGTCSPDYYRDAVALIKSRLAAPHVFVFSDDFAWARENLGFDVPTTFVEANSPADGFRDMQLMSLCRHHIIANSSFSWWGAWLNPSADKIVIAPRQWFRAAANDVSTLLPDGWIKL